MQVKLFPLFLFILSCSLSHSKNSLIKAHFVHHNGYSETITEREKLRLIEQGDFSHSSPYKKVLKVYQVHNQNETKALLTSYHSNGQIKQSLEIENGRARGMYGEWFAKGIKKLEISVHGGEPDFGEEVEKSWIFHGLGSVWNEEGKLIAQIPYEEGMLHGEMIRYFPHGSVKETLPIERGKLSGTVKKFYPNGALKSSNEYHLGVREGTSLTFSPDGTLLREEEYERGLLDCGRYFSFEGKLLTTIEKGRGWRVLLSSDSSHTWKEYQNGKAEGEVRLFTREGALRRLYHLHKGLMEGEDWEYYPVEELPPVITPSLQEKLPLPKLLVNWRENCLQGVIKTWYSSGQLETQREMSKNKKQGITSAWYLNGSLMYIEEYDQNFLKRGTYFKKDEYNPISKVSDGMGMATLFDSEGNLLRKISYEGGLPIVS